MKLARIARPFSLGRFLANLAILVNLVICAAALNFGKQKGAIGGLQDAAKAAGEGRVGKRTVVAGLAYGSEYGHFLSKFVSKRVSTRSH